MTDRYLVPLLLSLSFVWGCAAGPPVVSTPVAAADAEAPAWLVSFGGLGVDIPFALTACPGGELLVAGSFANRAAFDGEVLEAPRIRDIFVVRLADQGEVRWARGLGARAGDEPRAAVADPDGGVWLTGFFTDTIGGGDDAGRILRTHGGADAFVVKIAAGGRTEVAAALGGPLGDNGNAIALDGEGNVLVAGSFQGAMEVGGLALRSAGGRDAFVVSLDSAGGARWALRFGGAGSDEARGVAVTADGRVWVAGSFESTASTESGATLSARGMSDIFVLGLDPAGGVETARAFGGTGQDRLVGLAATADGVALGGDFRGELLGFDGEALVDSAGGTDVFVLQLDAGGALRSAAGLGGKVTDQALTVASSSRGGVLVGGYFQGRADLDPGPGTRWVESPDPTNADGFVVELSATGSLVGGRRLGGPGVEQVLALTATSDGGFAAAGLFKNGLVIGDLGTQVEARGKSDVFVLRSSF